MTEPGDWSALSKLTKYTWRGGQYANYWFMSADGETKHTQWFGVDVAETPEPDFAQFHQYFSVHPALRPGSTSQRATKNTVSVINCLFADFDAKDEVLPDEYGPYLPDGYSDLKPAEQRTAVKTAQEHAMMLDLPAYKARALAKVDNCKLQPSWLNDTGGGYQCFWLLNDPVPLHDGNRERIEALQAEFVQVIGADPGAKDLSRVLRIPGSLNVKAYFAPNYPTVTVLEADTRRRYDLSEFETLTGIDETYMAAQKAKPPHREDADPVWSKFNEKFSVGEILKAHGYKLGRKYPAMGIERYSRPGREKDQTSVVVFTNDNRSYHHSSSDQLYCNGHSRDAGDLVTQLDFKGDAGAAYKEIKKQIGAWTETVEVDTKGQEATRSETTEEDTVLLEWAVHDHGNASVVNRLHPDAFAFCDALGWMANAGTHFTTENAERSVNLTVTGTLIQRRLAAVKAQREDVVKGTVPTTSRKNAVKDMYKDLVVTSLGEFDKDPDVLNCANGVVDLRTGELVAHGSSNRFTYCVPTPYIPHAQPDMWLKFLSESVGDYDQIAEWLCMAYGYAITGQTTEECMFYAEGPTRSGKGTFALSQLELLGYPLATSVDFSTFTAKRDGNSQNFDLADLRAARLIVAAESGRYSSLNEAVVKNITGNDQIRCAHKHRDFFTYTPQFKIWLSSNYPIKGDVDDDAFWGRVRVIRFPNSHLGSEDKTLKRRLASPENLLGILAWAVEGAKRWYASPQGLVTPKAVAVATQKARDELDHVQQWLEECAEPSIGNTVTNALLYTSYQNWCEENGHTPKKAAAFGRALASKGFEAGYKKVMGRSVRAYHNLALIEDK